MINTHWHADHVGGNELIAKSGSTIAGGNVSGAIADAGEGAAVVAHENVLVRMSGQETPPPFEAWPTVTLFMPQKDLYFNGEAIEILHQPAAHTDGDSLVFFRRSDVVSTGDVFTTTGYPVIRPEDGGGIDGVIAALNRIIAITVPEEKQEGGTLVIPGHGRLCDEADVVEYRDMVTIIRDRIKAMVDMGMTLRQVQAAKPTADYDGRYGATSGLWTTEQFVAAAYESLKKRLTIGAIHGNEDGGQERRREAARTSAQCGANVRRTARSTWNRCATAARYTSTASASTTSRRTRRSATPRA